MQNYIIFGVEKTFGKFYIIQTWVNFFELQAFFSTLIRSPNTSHYNDNNQNNKSNFEILIQKKVRMLRKLE